MLSKISGFFMSIVMFVCSILGIGIGKIDGDEIIQYNKRGTQVNVVLEENASTGYMWSVSSENDGIVKLVNDRTISTTSDMVGAPSTRVFTFRPVSVGKTTLTFTYERSWEDGAARTVVIEMEVLANKTITATVVSDTEK